MLARIESYKYFHLLTIRKQNGIVTLEDGLAVFRKKTESKHALTI